MDKKTKNCINMITSLASVTELRGNIVISKSDNKFVGIDIKFEPPLDLDNFPSIKHAANVLLGEHFK